MAWTQQLGTKLFEWLGTTPDASPADLQHRWPAGSWPSPVTGPKLIQEPLPERVMMSEKSSDIEARNAFRESASSTKLPLVASFNPWYATNTRMVGSNQDHPKRCPGWAIYLNVGS